MGKGRCSRLVVFLVLTGLVVACGGGGSGAPEDGGAGGGSPGGETTTNFSGDLDELREISPTLTFDVLNVGGLELTGSAHIKAKRFKLTGRVFYSYTACEYRSAPSLSLTVAGGVEILGGIALKGRSGTRTGSSSTCNSCYGQDGGDLSIVAGGDVRIAGEVDLSGGSGSYSSGVFNFGCSGGDSGAFAVSGHSINLNGAKVIRSVGSGGTASGGNGRSGSPGPVDIVAADLFQMRDGRLWGGGALTFMAARTDICGPLGGTPESPSDVLIGGAMDTTAPTIVILSPAPNALIEHGKPLTVQVQASDEGLGVTGVVIHGMGPEASGWLYGDEFVDGVLTMSIPEVDFPISLSVYAKDNLENDVTVAVPGLQLKTEPEVEPNESLATAQALTLPVFIAGDVDSSDSHGEILVRNCIGGTCFISNRYTHDLYLVSGVSGAFSCALDFSSGSVSADLQLTVYEQVDTDMFELRGAYTGSDPAAGDYTETCSFTMSSEKTYLIRVLGDVTPSRTDYLLQVKCQE